MTPPAGCGRPQAGARRCRACARRPAPGTSAVRRAVQPGCRPRSGTPRPPAAPRPARPRAPVARPAARLASSPPPDRAKPTDRSIAGPQRQVTQYPSRVSGLVLPAPLRRRSAPTGVEQVEGLGAGQAELGADGRVPGPDAAVEVDRVADLARVGAQGGQLG